MQAWAERAQMMSLHGMSRDAWKRHTAEGSWYYEVVAPGFKYNLTDVAAALGLRQLTKQDRFLAERRAIAQRYTRRFDELPEVEVADRPGPRRDVLAPVPAALNLDRLTADRAERHQGAERPRTSAPASTSSRCTFTRPTATATATRRTRSRSRTRSTGG